MLPNCIAAKGKEPVMKRYMFRSALCALFVAICAPAVLHAQSSIIGKYTGSFTTHGLSRYRNVGVSLVISSVEGAAVKGTATVNGGDYCPGNYVMEGTYINSMLDLKSTKGPDVLGCEFKFAGKVEGNGINGIVDGIDVRMNR